MTRSSMSPNVPIHQSTQTETSMISRPRSSSKALTSIPHRNQQLQGTDVAHIQRPRAGSKPLPPLPHQERQRSFSVGAPLVQGGKPSLPSPAGISASMPRDSPTLLPTRCEPRSTEPTEKLELHPLQSINEGSSSTTNVGCSPKPSHQCFSNPETPKDDPACPSKEDLIRVRNRLKELARHKEAGLITEAQYKLVADQLLRSISLTVDKLKQLKEQRSRSTSN